MRDATTHTSSSSGGSSAKLVNRGIVPKGRGCDPSYHALPPTVVTNFAEDPKWLTPVGKVGGRREARVVGAQVRRSRPGWVEPNTLREGRAQPVTTRRHDR